MIAQSEEIPLSLITFLVLTPIPGAVLATGAWRVKKDKEGRGKQRGPRCVLKS